MKSQEELEYDERVKKRVLILKDLMVQGKIKFAESMRKDLEESFSKARFDENGEPDLATIDGRIRSIALAAEHFDYREKTKDHVSLFEIQSKYFSTLEQNFDVFYKEMVKHKLTPHEVANHVAYGKGSIDFLDDGVNSILDYYQEFWNAVSETAYIHVEDQYNSVKAVFGGDLFPQNDENIASKCGIYTDTIVLPCPFIRSRGLFKTWNKQQRVYYLLKLSLNVLQYKDLALADLEKPIVVILPDKEMMSESAFEQIQKLGEKDTLFHAKKVFGREFNTLEELLNFGKELDTVDKVIKEIKDQQKVLFDTEFKESLKLQIEKQVSGQSKQLMATDNPGIIVSMLGLGRMGVCNELLMKSLIVNGVPLIDAPTSWEYFKWKLEYDSERSFPNQNFDKLHVVKGLNGLTDTKLNWIGRIPPEGLIELRKSGAIDEVRAILSNGIEELIKSNELDFAATSNKVFENLNQAYLQHQQNISALKNKKWKVAGKDFGSWIVMGTIEIAAACTGTPFYGISTVILNQILDAPKLKDLPKTVDKLKDIEQEKRNLRKTPMGLIFKYK